MPCFPHFIIEQNVEDEDENALHCIGDREKPLERST